MNSVKYYMEHYDASVIDRIIDNHIKALEPIELPSDEEIEEKSNKRWWKGATPPSSFTEGAKWVIEHIKQQAKALFI